MNSETKETFLNDAYSACELSYGEIAKLCGTYANKIRRDAKKLGCATPRDKSTAQKTAISSGRHEHPTEGKELSEATKRKIGHAVADNWANLTDKERAHRSAIGKAVWNAMTPEQQRNLRAGAGDAIRNAAKHGSKLEKFIKEGLTKAGWLVEFHKEQIVTNQRLQVDLFLPELRTVIEVDGPSHFLPIWGRDVLARNRRSDNQKSGLILANGWCLLRVRQTQTISQTYLEKVWVKVARAVDAINGKFPPKGKRLIIIGGEDDDA
tara:strand:- start:2354 stop:3148 length:795 start_codon:yes stop_codon:yes gene_type:complete